MDIDGVFLPVAEELIDSVFPTPIKYLQTENPTYDPATGQTTPNVTEYAINAGICHVGGTSKAESRRNTNSGCGSTMDLLACQYCRRPVTACTTTAFIGRFTRSTRLIAATT